MQVVLVPVRCIQTLSTRSALCLNRGIHEWIIKSASHSAVAARTYPCMLLTRVLVGEVAPDDIRRTAGNFIELGDKEPALQNLDGIVCFRPVLKRG